MKLKIVLLLFFFVLVVNLGLGAYYFYSKDIFKKRPTFEEQNSLDWKSVENDIKANCKPLVLSSDQNMSDYAIKINKITKKDEQPPPVRIITKYGEDRAPDQKSPVCGIIFFKDADGVVEISYENEMGEIEYIKYKSVSTQ